MTLGAHAFHLAIPESEVLLFKELPKTLNAVIPFMLAFITIY